MYKFKWAIFGVAITNLLAVLLVIIFALPIIAPNHINNMIVDSVGSPWLSILPFSLVTIFFCLFSVLSKDEKKDEKSLSNYKNRDKTIAIINIIFISCCWLMIDVANSGTNIGESASISIMLLITIPVSLIVATISAYLPFMNQKKNIVCFPWVQKYNQIYEKTTTISVFVGLTCGLLIMIGSIVSLFTNIEWLGYVIMGAVIVLGYLIITTISYVTYLKVIPHEERKITPLNVQTKLDVANQKLETIDAIIDTHQDLQQEVSEKIANSVTKAENTTINNIVTDNIIQQTNLENVQDTTDYIIEKKAEEKEKKEEEKQKASKQEDK